MTLPSHLQALPGFPPPEPRLLASQVSSCRKGHRGHRHTQEAGPDRSEDSASPSPTAAEIHWLNEMTSTGVYSTSNAHTGAHTHAHIAHNTKYTGSTHTHWMHAHTCGTHSHKTHICDTHIPSHNTTAYSYNTCTYKHSTDNRVNMWYTCTHIAHIAHIFTHVLTV